MGHGYLGSVPESQRPVFLQTMGRRAEDAKRAGRTLEGRTWDEMPVNVGLVKA